MVIKKKKMSFLLAEDLLSVKILFSGDSGQAKVTKALNFKIS